MNIRPATKLALAILLVIPLTLTALFGCPSANGQEFRIESQVYTADSNLPVSQNITLFSAGLMYDFQLSDEAQPTPVEIVIFDARNRTLVLLDTERKIRLDMPELQLLKIVDGVRRATYQDKRSSFLVEDSFTEDVDWSTNWVTLTSPQIEYRFKGARPSDASVIPLYNSFLDSFTLLIASDPTKIPPFARMKLNQSIKRHGWIPTEVQISVKQNSLYRQAFSAKSKHVVIHQLSDNDRTRIETAKRYWSVYKPVELTEYRGLKKQSKFKLPNVTAANFEQDFEPKSEQSTKRR